MRATTAPGTSGPTRDAPTRVEPVIDWLRAHEAEISQSIYFRIRAAVPFSEESQDPDYEAGLFPAIVAIVSYCLDGIARGLASPPEPIPSVAAAQARRAARTGATLGTVQRRYIVGYREFGEFVTHGIEQNGLLNDGRLVQLLRRAQESLLEHLTAAIEHEYGHELALMASSPERRRMEIVRRLLAGEHLEPSELVELQYDIYASWHLGAVVTDASAKGLFGPLKARLGRRLLLIPQDDGIIWAWLAQQKPVLSEIEHMISPSRYPGISVAVGEPGEGMDGWRQTHREAQAGLLVALRTPNSFVRYSDCHFLAAAQQIDTLSRSLQQKHLSPLRSERDGGAMLRKTLRAWIDADGYVSSAAKLLNVDRHTVENHIRNFEKLTGRPLRRSCMSELDVALRLEES